MRLYYSHCAGELGWRADRSNKELGHQRRTGKTGTKHWHEDTDWKRSLGRETRTGN